MEKLQPKEYSYTIEITKDVWDSTPEEEKELLIDFVNHTWGMELFTL